jgi:ankyrin repeat protein
MLNVDLRTKKHKPLHAASWYGHLEIIDFLLKEGADPALKDNFARSSLHLVVESKLVDDEKTIEIAKLYIAKGADIKEVDMDGDTLMHETAWSKKKKCIAFLSKIGVPAKKNKLDKYPSETGIDKETQNYLKSLGY